MPFDPRRPFTRAEALAAGLTDSALRGRGFVTLVRGVYVSAQVRVGAWERAAAALLAVGESACVTGLTAAHVLGLPRGRARTGGSRSDHPTPRAARASPCGAVRRAHGTPRPGRPGRARRRHDAQGMVSCADLRQAAAAAPDPSGLATRAAGLVRDRVDSPMETRLRMLLVLAGLPEPTVDHRVRWADGTIRYRFDLSYPALKVAIEYDGQQHRADLDQWDSDVVRHDWFTAHGWVRVDVVERGVFQRPGETVDRVARVLAQRGWRGRPTDGWRPHFPERTAA